MAAVCTVCAMSFVFLLNAGDVTGNQCYKYKASGSLFLLLSLSMGAIISCISGIFQCIGDCIMGIVGLIAGCLECIIGAIASCLAGIADCLTCGACRRSRTV
ncbi:hypothetical protein C8R43DRAFT_1051804 [Mycena crocata]|nr:hypothetical protein C8R43DRAFT_1051804 [Mycena crocata]